MGLRPPPTVKEMAHKYGLRPKRKIREFRFQAAKQQQQQQANHNQQTNNKTTHVQEAFDFD
eukprot:CAMPEP_0202706076 /NCGR_PEP_ID=MMETSP1385-20130828/18554_1 /ASSEMBLY_ACC=CAM_ASM_000861 /TAXON_ID=933848 /ORGANISM="Elphidium margaritaceum" /LENGTH=60 /DNA_ID=CAMNT_0049364461 /DNA_START=75 /DNA_END=254 /DNA_ORIENTATION=-